MSTDIARIPDRITAGIALEIYSGINGVALLIDGEEWEKTNPGKIVRKVWLSSETLELLQDALDTAAFVSWGR